MVERTVGVPLKRIPQGGEVDRPISCPGLTKLSKTVAPVGRWIVGEPGGVESVAWPPQTTAATAVCPDWRTPKLFLVAAG